MSLLASFALSGCFVFEEIDRGIEELDRYSPAVREMNKAAAKANSEETATASRSTEPRIRDKLAGWWRDALEEEPLPPNPNDGIVSCEYGNTVRFTRQSDCELRGGRVKSALPKPKGT